MHKAINTTREAAYEQMREKDEFHIRYLVKKKNRHIANKMLKDMNNRIKRDANGKVAKSSMENFKRMEAFKDEINIERLRINS